MIMSKLHLLVSLGILLTFSPVLGQKGFSPGYVILNSGDTLQGSIRDRSEDKIYKKIRFRGENTGRNKYSPYQIKGYIINGSEFESFWFEEQTQFFMFNYFNVEGRGEKVFLRVLARGPLSCYLLEYIDPDSGYPDGFELFKRENDNFFERATQGIFGLKKNRLSRYLQDCPSLVEKIQSGHIKRPMEVVDYYNTQCDRE